MTVIFKNSQRKLNVTNFRKHIQLLCDDALISIRFFFKNRNCTFQIHNENSSLITYSIRDIMVTFKISEYALNMGNENFSR